MLRIRFFNVGDGDAILVEEFTGVQVFRILIDTGRTEVVEGAPAATCAAHLQRAGVQRLDKVLISHLHIDHSGGLAALSDAGIEIGELISGYIPAQPGAMMRCPANAEKTIRNMVNHLNRWSQDIDRLLALNVSLIELPVSQFNVALTEKLSADIIMPDPASSRLQKEVWDRLFQGGKAPLQRQILAAKLRNPNSLRVRLHFAGREVELSADCYGMVWDRGAVQPCDIFKLPHHGDAKSVTPRLVRKLSPQYAVICCGRGYNPDKDRPSARAAKLLRNAGAQLWYTDAFNDHVQPVMRWPSVDFVIRESGEILPPA